MDGEAVEREPAGHDAAEVDGVVARTAVDGEGRVLAAVGALLAVRGIQIDGVVFLAGVQHHRFHSAVVHRVHAAALDRRSVELPRPAVFQLCFGLERVADDEALAARVALVVEIERVVRLGPLAVDAELALDVVQRALVLVALRRADVDLVKPAAGLEPGGQAGIGERYVERVGLGAELDRDVVGRVEDDGAGGDHVEAGDAVAHVSANVGVVVAGIIDHDLVDVGAAVEMQLAGDEVDATQRVRMQPGLRRTDCELVFASAAVHVGRAVAVDAVDVEHVLAVAEQDVDGLDGARDRLEDVELVAAGIIDRRRERAIGDVVAGAEQLVVHGDLLVGPHAHAGDADGGQLPRCVLAGGVAVDVEGVVAALAEEGNDAGDRAADRRRLAAGVERVVTVAGVDEGDDVARHAVDLDGVRADAGFGIRAQVNAVDRAAVAALAGVDHQAAELGEVARQALERRHLVVVDAAGGEERLAGVARGVDAIGAVAAFDLGARARYAGNRLHEDAVVRLVAAQDRGVAGVDAVRAEQLDEVEVPAAGNEHRRRPHDVALDGDGAADVGVAIRRVGVAMDLDRGRALDHRAGRQVDVVARKHLHQPRRRDVARRDGDAELRLPADHHVQVLVAARRVVHRQAYVAGRGSHLHHVERAGDFGKVDAVLRLDVQAARPRRRRVELDRRAGQLPGARAEDLDVVRARADAPARDIQVDLLALDVGALVVVGIQDGAVQGDQNDVRVLRGDATQAQVARGFLDVELLLGDAVDPAVGLLRRVDLEEVRQEADLGIGDLSQQIGAGTQRDAVADDPGGESVVGRAVGNVVHRAVQRLERDVARVRADQLDAEVAGGLGEVDVAVGNRVDVAGALDVGVGPHADAHVGDARRERVDDDVSARGELAEVVRAGDRRGLAGVGVDRRIELRRRAGVRL